MVTSSRSCHFFYYFDDKKENNPKKMCNFAPLLETNITQMNIYRLLLISLFGLLNATSFAQANKYVGGDISLLTKYENSSAKYFDANGNQITSLLPFFQNQGLNAMRVRLFVDSANASETNKKEGVCQDLNYVIALAKRIKSQGFKFMLDLQYSDTWADPAKQWTPKRWVNASDAVLNDSLYKYTKNVLNYLVAAGATPDFIQTGNEISYGLCWGDVDTATPKSTYAGDTKNWSRFIDLLKNAGKACREVCPDAKIIIHTERVANISYLDTYYKSMASDGVDYDIIGLSYYPYYHGSLSQLSMALRTLERDFASKQIMIVETGYYHDYQPSSVTYDLTGTYDDTSEGQKQFTDALVDTLNNHKSVTGLFWWDMEANEYGNTWPDYVTPSGWYNAGLVDNNTGKVEPALYELKKFLGSSVGISSPTINDERTKDNAYYTISGQKIDDTHYQKGLIIHQGKKIIIK
jgi:arabinogalactan endo-1,4-beta-galactosidase